jgi:carboxyl-terminal processing protease
MKILRRLLTACILATCVIPAAAEPRTDEEKALDLESFDIVWTTIRDRHFDPELGGLDWEAIRDEYRPRVEQAADRGEALEATQQMIERLGHSHVAILPDEVLEVLASPAEEGSAMGVTGIDLRMVEGKPLVSSVLPGSTAAEAGVRTGWELVSAGDDEVAPIIEKISERFAGEPLLDSILADALRNVLRGPIGGKEPFRFADGKGETPQIEIGFAEESGYRFKTGHLDGLYVRVDARRLDDGIGFLSLSMFMGPNDVMPVINEALPGFADAPGVIVDIRGNPGGIIGMGMGLAGWFVTEKNHYLGKLILRDNELKAIVFPRPDAYAGPVAILIDGLSGSTSEIFSGGLQDLGRARIFGTRSAGAALPSEIVKLPNGDGFQYVFADYVSAGGEHLEGRGVIPDEEVPLTREALLAGRDPVLEAAARWIHAQAKPAETGEPAPAAAAAR